MNRSGSSANHLASNQPNPNELDDLLYTFFRRERPTKWQAPVPAAPTPTITPVQTHCWSSRWALAAAIGLLFFGSLFLSGRLGSSIRSEFSSNEHTDVAKIRPMASQNK